MHTYREDKIFIFGSAPNLYMSMHRDPPTKYFYINWWVSSRSIQNDIIHNLEKTHTKYVIVLKNTLYENGKAKIAKYLYNYIQTEYYYDCTLSAGYAGWSDVYLLNQTYMKVNTNANT